MNKLIVMVGIAFMAISCIGVETTTNIVGGITYMYNRQYDDGKVVDKAEWIDAENNVWLVMREVNEMSDFDSYIVTCTYDKTKFKKRREIRFMFIKSPKTKKFENLWFCVFTQYPTSNSIVSIRLNEGKKRECNCDCDCDEYSILMISPVVFGKMKISKLKTFCIEYDDPNEDSHVEKFYITSGFKKVDIAVKNLSKGKEKINF